MLIWDGSKSTDVLADVTTSTKESLLRQTPHTWINRLLSNAIMAEAEESTAPPSPASLQDASTTPSKSYAISEKEADNIVQSLLEADYFDASTMAPLSPSSLVSLILLLLDIVANDRERLPLLDLGAFDHRLSRHGISYRWVGGQRSWSSCSRTGGVIWGLWLLCVLQHSGITAVHSGLFWKLHRH